MIKRITNPVDFEKVVNDIYNLFGEKDKTDYHLFLPQDKDGIITAFSNTKILTWDFFCWANLSDKGNYDAVISFVNNKNEKFGEKIFSEYVWISDNPRVGYRLFAKALKFARNNDFKYIMMSSVSNHEKSEKITNFYKKIGFLKDSETYIAKL